MSCHAIKFAITLIITITPSHTRHIIIGGTTYCILILRGLFHSVTGGQTVHAMSSDWLKCRMRPLLRSAGTISERSNQTTHSTLATAPPTVTCNHTGPQTHRMVMVQVDWSACVAHVGHRQWWIVSPMSILDERHHGGTCYEGLLWLLLYSLGSQFLSWATEWENFMSA